MPAKRISIVIPALNESENLPLTLASCRSPEVLEVIVVDGGSFDDTVETARRAGARVLPSPRGRATQLNRGAAAAEGEVLLFVHADTLLPAGFGADVLQLLQRPGTIAGAFSFRIHQRGILFRAIEMAVNLRSRWISLPYGDQSLFLRRDSFIRLGGYPEIPIMEDFELVRRIKRAGRIRISKLPAYTSARRWNATGILRMTLINQVAVAAYLAGIAPPRLANWYRRKSKDRPGPPPG